MKKRICLFLVLIFITFLHVLPNTPYIPNRIKWDVFYISSRFEIFILSLALLCIIPYRNLASKCILGAHVIIQFTHIICIPFYYIAKDYPIVFFSIKGFLSFVYICIIHFRDYDKANDELDEEHFFRCSYIPKNKQDFILSLFKFDPVGGTGIYAQGKFYFYRRGEIVAYDKSYLMKKEYKYKIYKKDPIDERLDILKSLECSSYKKWTWIYNCVTVLEPIMSKRGKPLFKKPGRS